MVGFLKCWRQEAQGLYRQLPEGDDICDKDKHELAQYSCPQHLIRKLYQVAPFLLLLNLVIAAIWTAQGLSHIFRRPNTFAPACKV